MGLRLMSFVQDCARAVQELHNAACTGYFEQQMSPLRSASFDHSDVSDDGLGYLGIVNACPMSQQRP